MNQLKDSETIDSKTPLLKTEMATLENLDEQSNQDLPNAV